MTILALTLATLITSAISGIIGMGGGILLLSAMTFFLPIQVIIPVHGLVQLISNSTRLIFLRANIRWRYFFFFVAGLPLGAGLAALLLRQIVNEGLPYLVISLLIFYAVFKPKKMPQIQLHSWGWTVVGFFTGITGILAGAVGPLIAPFFIRDDMKKEEIVATKASMQMITHFSKIPVFLTLGFQFEDYTYEMLFMALAAIVGTKVGVGILGRVQESFFKKLYKSVLLISGLRLVYKFLETYL